MDPTVAELNELRTVADICAWEGRGGASRLKVRVSRLCLTRVFTESLL